MSLSALLPSFISALVVALLMSWLGKKITSYNPAGSASTIGTIKPHKGIAYFVIGMGIVFFTTSVVATVLFFEDMFILGPVCALLSASLAISSVPSLTSIQDVNWSEDNLTGPKAVRYMAMSLSHNDLKWADIVKIGLIKGPYHFVEDINGDRIYWSRGYKNYQDFEATLSGKRPDLMWPKFELNPKSNDGANP